MYARASQSIYSVRLITGAMRTVAHTLSSDHYTRGRALAAAITDVVNNDSLSLLTFFLSLNFFNTTERAIE